MRRVADVSRAELENLFVKMKIFSPMKANFRIRNYEYVEWTKCGAVKLKFYDWKGTKKRCPTATISEIYFHNCTWVGSCGLKSFTLL